MRRKKPVDVPGLDPTLAALLSKPAQPGHQVAYVYAMVGRLKKRGVISAPVSVLDHWKRHANGVGVEERFGLASEEPRLVECRGIDTGISLIEAVKRAKVKPKKASPLLENLCRVSHQNPRDLLK